ncbi:MAG: Co2+/Mg2+ efflux protein ApaG [Proteobacteria bacterium]|nr:Co2+/Mg2+ efflux protein ApaG [Pseudomonadota bacterium]MDE3207356.1 Co2+/Mg2+ efflux protein ApaG [Pseudomonadota bacterium]
MAKMHQNIKIQVTTHYLEEQSDINEERFMFAYTITINNTGKIGVQLIGRHWIITDANNSVQEVRGIGVVGEQPRLAPGEGYEYTSGTPLSTPIGTMKGSYQMVTDDGTEFDVPIDEFLLSVPGALH